MISGYCQKGFYTRRKHLRGVTNLWALKAYNIFLSSQHTRSGMHFGSRKQTSSAYYIITQLSLLIKEKKEKEIGQRYSINQGPII